MRFLGLDLGTKTLGIAISDKTNSIASPLTTLRFSSEDYESLIMPLKDIINENSITTIVLGLPKNMDSSLGFAAKRSNDFAEILKNNIDIPVVLVDERLTSVMAHNILSENGKKMINHKKDVDAVAACLILEDYLKRSAKWNLI